MILHISGTRDVPCARSKDAPWLTRSAMGRARRPVGGKEAAPARARRATRDRRMAAKSMRDPTSVLSMSKTRAVRSGEPTGALYAAGVAADKTRGTPRRGLPGVRRVAAALVGAVRGRRGGTPGRAHVVGDRCRAPRQSAAARGPRPGRPGRCPAAPAPRDLALPPPGRAGALDDAAPQRRPRGRDGVDPPDAPRGDGPAPGRLGDRDPPHRPLPPPSARRPGGTRRRLPGPGRRPADRRARAGGRGGEVRAVEGPGCIGLLRTPSHPRPVAPDVRTRRTRGRAGVSEP